MADFAAGLRRRVIRMEEDRAVFIQYGLGVNGRLSRSTRYDGWLETPAHLLRGEETAVAAGSPPMSSPSAAASCAATACHFPTVKAKKKKLKMDN